jgi:hypothetical protein
MDFPQYDFDFPESSNDFQNDILDGYSFELSDEDLLSSIENIDTSNLMNLDKSNDGPGRFVAMSEEDLTAIIDNAQAAGTKKKYQMDYKNN